MDAVRFDIEALSSVARWRHWGRGSDEGDAPILWPGFREVLRRSLMGTPEIVLAAYDSTTREVAARASFSQAPCNPNVWGYGYLVTAPQYRRQGLGGRIVRRGIEIARSKGAGLVFCYVAEGNDASLKLNLGSGFELTEISRCHVNLEHREQQATPMDLIPLDPAVLAPGPAECDFLHRVFSRPYSEVVSSILCDPKPLLPWRHQPSRVDAIYESKRLVAIAKTRDAYCVIAVDDKWFGIEVHAKLAQLSRLLIANRDAKAASIFLRCSSMGSNHPELFDAHDHLLVARA